MQRKLLETVTITAGTRVTRAPSGEIVVHGVKYLGTRSQNRNDDGTHNVYPEPTRTRAAPLYEGSAVFLDHAAVGVAERSYGEKLGRLRNAGQVRADGSYGDLHLNPRHPLAEQVAWDAEHSPDSLGLSHAAIGRGRAEGPDYLIEEIASVASVDVVHAGATTRGLFEAAAPEAAVLDLKDLTLEQLRELRPDLVTEIEKLAAAKPPEEPKEGDDAPPAAPAPKAEGAKAPEPNATEVALAEARREIEEIKLARAVEARRAKRERELTESRLPAEAVTPLWRDGYLLESDDARAAAALADRWGVYRAGAGRPTSGSAPRTTAEITSAEQLLAAL